MSMKEEENNLFKPIPLNKKDERREAKRKYEKGRRDRISNLIYELKSTIEKDSEDLTREEILKRAKQTILELKSTKDKLKSELEKLNSN